MKINFLIIVLISSYLTSFAQVVLPEIDFEALEEDWRFIPKDTNFVKSPYDNWSSPYWGLWCFDILANKNDIYIHELTNSQSPYGGVEGTLMHKLDINTGIPIWTYHNNIYSGNVHREMYHPQVMEFTEEGAIQIVGMRQRDTIDKTTPILWDYISHPIKKMLDQESGAMIEEVSSRDTFARYYTLSPNYSRVVPVGENSILNFTQHSYYENSTYYYSLDLFNVNDSMCIDTPYLARFSDEIGDLNSHTASRQLPQFSKLNRDTMLLLFVKSDTLDFELAPTTVSLQWLDVSDLNSLNIVNDMDLIKYVVYPQSFENGSIFVTTKDEYIIVRQLYEANGVYGNKFYWLVWLDKDGNELGYIPKLMDDEGKAYSRFHDLGMIDGALYLAAYNKHAYESSGDHVHDILKLEAFSNTIEKVGQIKLENPDDISSFSILYSSILPNDHLLLNIYIGFLNEEGYSTNFNMYCSFKPEVLGLPVPIEKIVEKNYQVKLFPNPARNNITVKFDDVFSGQLMLYDQYGRHLLQTRFVNEKEVNLELGKLSSGVYILKGLSEDAYRFEEKVIVLD